MTKRVRVAIDLTFSWDASDSEVLATVRRAIRAEQGLSFEVSRNFDLTGILIQDDEELAEDDQKVEESAHIQKLKKLGDEYAEGIRRNREESESVPAGHSEKYYKDLERFWPGRKKS